MRLPLTGVPAFECELGAHAYVGANRILRHDDFARDVRDEILDARRLIAAAEHLERGGFEQFGKARHVHARLVRTEVGHHRELRVEHAFLAVDIQPDEMLHARHTDAVEREANVGRFFLAIREEVHRARLTCDTGQIRLGGDFGDRFVQARIDVTGSDLDKRHEIERPRRDVRMRHFEPAEIGAHVVEIQDVDVDRTRAKERGLLAADRGLDAADERLERHRIEFGRHARRDVEKGRTRNATRGRRLIVRRDLLDARFAAQLLQRAENRALTITEIGPKSDEDGMHTRLKPGWRMRSCCRGCARHAICEVECRTPPGRDGGEHLCQLYGLCNIVHPQQPRAWQ